MEPDFKITGRCAKQTTVAVIVNGDNVWIGTNRCDNPQEKCPRGDMPTGHGYSLCKEVCGQRNHAEVDACLKAGEGARGGTLYLIGHYYICADCQAVMDNHGINRSVIWTKTA